MVVLFQLTTTVFITSTVSAPIASIIPVSTQRLCDMHRVSLSSISPGRRHVLVSDHPSLGLYQVHQDRDIWNISLNEQLSSRRGLYLGSVLSAGPHIMYTIRQHRPPTEVCLSHGSMFVSVCLARGVILTLRGIVNAFCMQDHKMITPPRISDQETQKV